MAAYVGFFLKGCDGLRAEAHSYSPMDDTSAKWGYVEITAGADTFTLHELAVDYAYDLARAINDLRNPNRKRGAAR